MPEVIKKKETLAEEISPEKGSGISRREFLIGLGGAAASAFFASRLEAGVRVLEKRGGRKEIKGAPRVFLEFFFAYHVSAEDIRGLEEKFKEADAIALEAFGWKEEIRTVFDEVSKGRRSVKDVVEEGLKKAIEKSGGNPDAPIPPQELEKAAENYKSTFQGRILETIHNSQKPVFFFDLPAGHPLIDYTKVTKFKFNFDEGFEEILRRYRGHEKFWVDSQKSREAVFASKLIDLKEDLRKNPDKFPEFRGKRNIRILIPFGAMHTGMYHNLLRSSGDVSRTFAKKLPDKPFIFGAHDGEMFRAFYFGKEVSDELAARAFFLYLTRYVLYYNVEGYSGDVRKVRIWERGIANKVSLEEIKKMFDLAREIGPDESVGAFFNLIAHKLLEKGIKIPESGEELEKMVLESYPYGRQK